MISDALRDQEPSEQTPLPHTQSNSDPQECPLYLGI